MKVNENMLNYSLVVLVFVVMGRIDNRREKRGVGVSRFQILEG